MRRCRRGEFGILIKCLNLVLGREGVKIYIKELKKKKRERGGRENILR